MHTQSAMPVFSNLTAIRPALAMVCALLLGVSAAQAAGPTGLLNDTGQTQCADANHALVACDSATTGNAGTRPGQDGRFGRDVASPTKVGGGAAGFDFSRVCFNGDVQGSGTCTGTLVPNTTAVASGTPTTDWACTRDNITNLIWSLQYQEVGFTVNWNEASAATYPNAGHNSVGRCGFNSGWRLPTRRELLSTVHLGKTVLSAVDGGYLPATAFWWYWTSNTSMSNPGYAWIVNFQTGESAPLLKTTDSHVRLVRSGE